MSFDLFTYRDVYGSESPIKRQSSQISPVSNSQISDLTEEQQVFYKSLVRIICNTQCPRCKTHSRDLIGKEMTLLNEGFPFYSTIVSRSVKCHKCSHKILLMKKEDYGCFGLCKRVYWEKDQDEFVCIDEDHEIYKKPFDKLVQF